MTATKTDVYQIVTDKIIEALDNGVIPWRKPWGTSTRFGESRNAISGRAYSGVNAILCSLFEQSNGYTDLRYLTFNQARTLGGMVRKGEKGLPIVFYKRLTVKSKEEGLQVDGEENTGKSFLMARYFTVFNVSQCDGLPEKYQAQATDIPSPSFDPIEECERVVTSWTGKPSITDNGNLAFYSPARDAVTMPFRELFNAAQDYYATLFHELAHSTGHQSRLNREEVANPHSFGTKPYAKEELVAEISSAFLCAATGIENKQTLENTASYIANWRQRLSEDKKLIFSAASSAQKASDMILGVSRTFDSEEKE